jgi:hypothetical protein
LQRRALSVDLRWRILLLIYWKAAFLCLQLGLGRFLFLYYESGLVVGWFIESQHNFTLLMVDQLPSSYITRLCNLGKLEELYLTLLFLLLSIQPSFLKINLVFIICIAAALLQSKLSLVIYLDQLSLVLAAILFDECQPMIFGNLFIFVHLFREVLLGSYVFSRYDFKW